MTLSFPFSWFWAAPSSPDDNAGRSARGRRASSSPPVEAGLPESSADAQIVKQVRSGDALAFETLFLQHHRRLWAFAYNLTGSSDVADEIVQDVFASLWIRRERWSVLHSIAEYLFGAVRNLAYKARRHRAIVQRAEQVAIDTADVPALGETPADPSQSVETADLNARLSRALARMPEGRRTAFLLWWRDQLTNQEIAQIMGTSANAVGAQLSRARHELRFLLEKSM